MFTANSFREVLMQLSGHLEDVVCSAVELFCIILRGFCLYIYFKTSATPPLPSAVSEVQLKCVFTVSHLSHHRS